MSKTKSAVMTIANRLVKGGMNRSLATAKAWVIARMEAFRAKVTGVTLAGRQNALQKLSDTKGNITVTLKREPHNSHDSNAIAVYAVKDNIQAFFIGYLKKAVSFILAPLMDKGEQLTVKGVAVVGGFNEYVNYGMRLLLAI